MVSKTKPEYTNIVVLDYKSLYPYVMIRNNISFETIRAKILKPLKPYSEIHAREQLYKFMIPEQYTIADLQHFYRYVGTGRVTSKLFGFLFALERELLLSQQFKNIPILVELTHTNGTTETVEMTFYDLYDYTVKNKYTVTFNGALYDAQELGIVPRAEMILLKQRDYYKKLLEQAEQLGDKLLITRYDGTQLAYKLMANAGFGASGNTAYFGFNAYVFEAITLTAQFYSIMATYVLNEYVQGKDIDTVIQNMNHKAFILGKSEYGKNKQQIALYTDTDSIILYLKDLVSDHEKRLQIINELANVFNNMFAPIIVKRLVNNDDFYEKYKNYNPKFKAEFIGSRALFTSKKKRYIILDSSMTDLTEEELLDNFDDAFKVAGFEVVKEVANPLYRKGMQLLFVKLLKGTINIYSDLHIQAFFKSLSNLVAQEVKRIQEQLKTLKQDDTIDIDIDEILSDIADTVAWKSSKYVFMRLEEIVKEAQNDHKKLQKTLNDLPAHVLSMIAYNTLTNTDMFTPGSKGYSFTTKPTNKFYQDISTYLIKDKKINPVLANTITDKLKRLSIFVSAYGDIDYILKYVDFNSFITMITEKMKKRILEIIEELRETKQNKTELF